ncbi:MAG: outer membrane protein [Boseongicola sp.]
MLKRPTSAFAFLLAFGLTGGSAIAEDQNSFDRFDGGYLGAQVGIATAGTDFAIAGTPIFDSDFNGGVIGVFGGYGWQNDRRYLGVEVGAAYSGVKDGNFLPVGGTPWLTGEVERIYGITLFGKAGKVVGEEKKTLVYGLFGPSVVRVKANATLTGLGSVNDSANYPGLTLGVGVEHYFNDNFSARVQGSYTKYYDVGSLIEGLTSEKYDSNGAAIQFGITRRFGR